MQRLLALILLMFFACSVSALTRVTFKTNVPIKIFLNKKHIDSDFYLNRALKPGLQKIVLYTESGAVLDKREIDVRPDEHLMYNYAYTSKGNAALRSALLPSLGQLTTDRCVMGGIISAATVGSIGYIVSELSKFNDNEDKYDTATANHNYSAANQYREDCDTANNNIIMGAGVLGAVYIYNIIDAYLFTTEKRLKIIKEGSEFSIKPIIGSINSKTSFGFAINF